MHEPAFLSSTELLAALAANQTSSSELLEYYIARYQRYNAAINAIVHRDLDSARQRARAADSARIRGESWGPLHGLPMTIKESIEVIDMPCTAGVPSLAAHVSSRNSDVADALISAGAIVFGKTNVSKLTQDMQSYNALYGQTNNPWNPKLVPGGSSGGSAAAVAAGLSAADIGSDLGGSVRIPAHCCGIYGHKPSFGIVSLRGHVPPLPAGSSGDYHYDGDLGVIGPLTRSAQDLDLLLDVIAAPPAAQKVAYRLQLPPPRKRVLEEFRVGLWLDDAFSPVDAQVTDVLANFVNALSTAGARIAERRPDIDFASSHSLFAQLLNAIGSGALPEKIYNTAQAEASLLDSEDRGYQAQWLRGVTISHRTWHQLNRQRYAMREKWAEYFKTFDVLLCPVIPVTAFAHDHSNIFDRTLTINGRRQDYLDTLLSWNGLATVAYLPATVMPVGLAKNSMPVGVQVIGPYLEDKTPIEFARLASQQIGPWQAPPGFPA